MLVVSVHPFPPLLKLNKKKKKKKKKKKEKLALFMKRIINFQQMMRCKGVLHRKDWKITNLHLVPGLQEDGPG